MSFATIYSRAIVGVDAPQVKIEVHISNGLPSFQIVGLPDTGVRESRDRVRSAIINSQFEFPQSRLTVNLSPADIPKEGARYDLAIAIGILAASKQLSSKNLNQYEFIGELGLNGELRVTKANIPAALAIRKANRIATFPLAVKAEISVISALKAIAAPNLLSVFQHLMATALLPYIAYSAPAHQSDNDDLVCFSDVLGQEQAKRVLEIAAAGQHNLIMMGAPGTGKSMLAQRMLTILPEMNEDEAIETAAIHSIIGKSITPTNWKTRPFRSPHHTVSGIALVGGGSIPKPGEISLAQNGVLFLDELPEFGRKVLDVLREPMETGKVTISRAAHQADFPASFQLIAALNPSPTGHYNDGRCQPDKVLQYLNKISGPILDRIDLQIEVANIKASELTQYNVGETSETIKNRVVGARQLMLNRAGKPNGLLTSKELQLACPLSSQLQSFLQHRLEALQISVRAFHKILKVARTIADLANCKHIEQQHIAEALSYRAMDRLLHYLTKQV